MNPATPEAIARSQIDAMLTTSHWQVQDYRQFNPASSRGIALREVPLKSGPCDYRLVLDRRSAGIGEARRVGTSLSTVADFFKSCNPSIPLQSRTHDR